MQFSLSLSLSLPLSLSLCMKLSVNLATSEGCSDSVGRVLKLLCGTVVGLGRERGGREEGRKGKKGRERDGEREFLWQTTYTCKHINTCDTHTHTHTHLNEVESVWGSGKPAVSFLVHYIHTPHLTPPTHITPLHLHLCARTKHKNLIFGLTEFRVLPPQLSTVYLLVNKLTAQWFSKERI